MKNTFPFRCIFKVEFELNTEGDGNITFSSEGVLKRLENLVWSDIMMHKWYSTDQINLRIKCLWWIIACSQKKLKVHAYYDKRVVHDEKFHVSPLYHNNLYGIKHPNLTNLKYGTPDTNQQFRPRKEKHIFLILIWEIIWKKTYNICTVDLHSSGTYSHCFSCIRQNPMK